MGISVHPKLVLVWYLHPNKSLYKMYRAFKQEDHVVRTLYIPCFSIYFELLYMAKDQKHIHLLEDVLLARVMVINEAFV